MFRFSLFAFFIALNLNLFSQAFQIDTFRQSSAFQKTNLKIINSIIVIGNKTTKEKIILRELEFRIGDSLTNQGLTEAISQSKKNLLNTSLFNFANLNVALTDSVNASIIIQVTERWYIFPLPIFEIDDNNFNTWWRTKDLSRINYGMYLTHYNFRGRKEKLILTAKYGFTERYQIRYEIPYLTRSQKLGLNIDVSYNRRDEIAYNSLNNERLQYKDADNDALRNLSNSITLTYRNKIFKTHSFTVNYSHNEVTDSVVRLNENFLLNNKNRLDYFRLSYQLASDKRDSRNYPLKGSFWKASITQYGLGVFSDLSLLNLNIEAKKFIEIKPRLYLAGSVRALLTPNTDQPYLLRNGLGYSSFGIRSYEYYVIDGQNIGLGRLQLRYQIVKPRSMMLTGISERFGKFHYAFYLGVFSDFAYVDDQSGYPMNNLANELQFGHGLGLDFVSYYDIVIRAEYSFNKFGESGLFLHFVAPI
ncbi:MAG: outer membrane protein assembly factor BamA [Vicingaceae bacterium]|jgi:outer membrane protein assembly factor BamA